MPESFQAESKVNLIKGSGGCTVRGRGKGKMESVSIIFGQLNGRGRKVGQQLERQVGLRMGLMFFKGLLTKS